MVDIRFLCPACNAKLAVDDAVAGYEVDCPECRRRIRIPKVVQPGESGQVLSQDEIDFLTQDGS